MPMTIVRPSRPALSRARKWLGYLCIPFCIAFLVAADSLLTANGMPPGERPGVVRVAMIAIALIPVAVVVATPALPVIGGHTYDWDKVASLNVVVEGWRYWG